MTPFIFRCTISIYLLIVGIAVNAQNDPIPVRKSAYDEEPKVIQQHIHHKIDLGAGFGLDYGGFIGVQAGYSPVKHLIVFGAAGYHLIKFGWEVGAKGLFLANTTKNTVRPYGKIMYGNNAVIVVQGIDEYNKTYVGLTAGVGTQLRFGKTKQHGIDIDLNVPFRTQTFKDDYDNVKNDPMVDITQDLLPVAISIGYHHEF
jgi:hypothetical protein